MPDEFQQRLRQMDDQARGEHYYLEPADEILYWREYTADRDYSFSATNQFIANLKKSPTKPANQLFYKNREIARAGQYFTAALNPDWVKDATFVPIPCSKKSDHAEYDDRMTRVCRGITCGQHRVDVRELVYVTQSMEAAHTRGAGSRPKPTELQAIYRINEAVAAPAPTAICIVDDVITAGAHFRAMSNVIRARYPGIPILGLFVARRVKPPAEFENLDEI